MLPRRASPLQRAQEASQATAAARKSIDAIMSSSRVPWGGKAALSGLQVEELEKALRALEAKVGEREMALAEAENKLAERDRVLAETEALLQAREKVIDAMRKQPAAQTGATVNPEEMEALGKLKEELDRQESNLKEQRQQLQEREDFLNQSETALFEKMQAQQEEGDRTRAKGRGSQETARQAGVPEGRTEATHRKGLTGGTLAQIPPFPKRHPARMPHLSMIPRSLPFASVLFLVPAFRRCCWRNRKPPARRTSAWKASRREIRRNGWAPATRSASVPPAQFRRQG